MTRVLFKMQNRPDCPYKLPKRKAKNDGLRQLNDQKSGNLAQ